MSSLASGFSQASNNVPRAAGSGGGSARKYSLGYMWGSTNKSHKWNKKRIITMTRERFETQKTIFMVYIKFWMENMFYLFGLEINMVALLLASFALLNAISMLYIALLAAGILLNCNVIQKLWPAAHYLPIHQTSSKAESVFPFEFYDSPANMNAESLHVMNSADYSFEFSHCEITEAEKDGGGSLYDSDKKERARGQAEDNSIVSAVQLLGDGG